MNERILQHIWQFQLFNNSELSATTGESVKVLNPGRLNTNQGPDFSNARIRIKKTTWAGSVEIHIRSSDWNKHGHHLDSNYENVVLHVVWEHDQEVENTTSIPVVELSGRVPKSFLERYEQMMSSASFIPCAGNLSTVDELVWKSWKDRLVAERLTRKAEQAAVLLKELNYHWVEVFWILLARSFGAKVNVDAFESIARSIPLNVLARHKNQIHQLEALLLGQAGLLGRRFTEDYPKMLQREYRFLKKKYSLRPISIPLNFLRMRPRNFPTVRLAQLAMLVHGSAHLFTHVRETKKLEVLLARFDVTANDYWHYHFRLGEPSSFQPKKLGNDMRDSIVINTVAPMLFAYGQYHQQHHYTQRAIDWLEKTDAESNRLTRGFESLGIRSTSAFDSQALIQLKQEYCEQKRCLECAIGVKILGR